MKLWAVLSKINELLDNPRARRKRSLYKQWLEMDDLPHETITQEEVRAHRIREKGEREDKTQLQMPVLYILLGACLIISFAILIILIIHAC